jgi:hypothetical protein
MMLLGFIESMLMYILRYTDRRMIGCKQAQMVRDSMSPSQLMATTWPLRSSMAVLLRSMDLPRMYALL